MAAMSWSRRNTPAVLGWVAMTQGHEDVLMTTLRGQTIRFTQDQVRSMGRPASGVIGINLDDDDRVVGMDLVREGMSLLVVTAHGFGKRTDLNEYPAKGRATGGVISIKLRPKDEVAVAKVVSHQSLLTFITTMRELSLIILLVRHQTEVLASLTMFYIVFGDQQMANIVILIFDRLFFRNTFIINTISSISSIIC